MATRRYTDGYRSLRQADTARLVAFDVLVQVTLEGAFANLVLPRALRVARRDVPSFTSRDAAFAAELAYGTLRAEGRLDWVIRGHLSRPLEQVDPAVAVLLRMGAHQLLDMRVPDHAAVAATVDLARQVITAGPVRMVNAVLRAIAREGIEQVDRRIDQIEDPVERLSVRHAHPEWMVRAFSEALSAHGLPPSELEDLLAADNAAPLVTLVARPGLIDPADLADQAQDILGTRVAPGDVSDLAVVLESGDPAALPSVRAGLAGAQDEGSQLAALATVAAPLDGPDHLWLDLCAGPGGKTALLGCQAVSRGARVVANEVHPHRARLVEHAVRALPDDTVEVVSADGRTFGGARSPWPEGCFDRVLVDAPCTGMGSLRRRPESRWRRRPEDLEELTALQAALLDRALDLVRPGGILAYVTCSPHVRETLDQVRRLAATGRVEVLDTQRIAAGLAPAPLGIPDDADLVDQVGRIGEPGRVLQLWGHRQGTDLMFVALMRRAHTDTLRA